MRDGLVCCALHGEEVALVVPDDHDLRTDLLTLHHDSPLAGHLGLYRMSRALSKRYLLERYASRLPCTYSKVSCLLSRKSVHVEAAGVVVTIGAT